MKRTKLSERILPPYTRGEEIMNMVTHIVGGAVGIVALVLCVIRAALHGDAYAVVSSSIFGFSMILLYTMSSIYHGLKPDKTAKKVFQIIDHCSIFFLIAGTYTPIALCTLREYNTALGWIIFGIIWGMTVIGVALNAIDIKAFSKLSMAGYIIMGWCVIFTIKQVYEGIGIGGMVFLVGGGIAYTVGAMLYHIGKKKKFIHSVFHIFTVIASLLHFFCIFFYIV